MGLRQSKQTKQRGEIIENAIALFRARGIEAVRVRDVAEACEVSEATFFNYFANKDAVIAEWAEGRLDAAMGAALSTAGDHSLRRPVRELVRKLAREIEIDAAFMREAWLRVRAIRSSPRGRGRVAPPAGLRDAVARAQERGELRADVSAGQLAEMLRSALVSTLAQWLAGEGEETGARQERDGLEARLSRCADVLLDGFRKRNERVRANVAAPARRVPSPAASPR
jgi:AcrR family transcriptional regulator